MSKHDHSECDHDLKYCKHCDTVYCENCDREWKKPVSRNWYTGTVEAIPSSVKPPYTISYGNGNEPLTNAVTVSDRHIHS